MLLLFTEAGQLTFPEQKYSWETTVGNLEGKRGGGKGRKAENKCFFSSGLCRMANLFPVFKHGGN